ncbi:MAG: aldo/keto reductase [Bacteroidales bacterium]|nr:aldo/keto reductase [Bacteroidales bacterium]
MEKQGKFNRRGFLKSSVIGATGLVAGQSVLAKAQGSSISEPKSEEKTIYRTLGKTGIKLPIVSMGVMRADNPNLVKAALAKGVTHLDTAHGYQKGKNEEMLGVLLQDYPRDSYTIATKIKQPGADRKTGMYNDEATEQTFLDMFAISMERLKLDYVDILYHHMPPSGAASLHEPTVKAMKKLQKQGKVKFLGVSTHSKEPEILQTAIDSGVYDVVLTAYNFKQDHVKELTESINKAAEAGIGIVAMKTMAGGFYDKERQNPVNTKAALKWAMQNPNVHTSIPGYTNFDMLDESFGIMADLPLTEKEKMDLKEGTNLASLYCNGCRECIPQCKKELPVNDLMRAYMYTYGYKNLEKAHSLLSSLEIDDNPCKDCHNCTISCTAGFNISQKISDVSRLMTVPEDFIT